MSAGDKAMRELAQRTSAWLARENGTDWLAMIMQAIVKPGEELGEVREALRAGDYSDAADECADVIVTARTAQETLSRYPGELGRPLDAAAIAGRDVRQLCDTLTDTVLDLNALGVAWIGQNPRKPRGQVSSVDIAAHLDWVILRAAQLIATLGRDVDEVLLARAATIHGRLDKMGVAQ